MKYALLATVLLTAPLLGQDSRIQYPEAQRGAHVDTYFDETVADPYRWFEDLNSQQTAAWVEAENAISLPFLAGLEQREAIKERLTELWNYERYGTPFEEAGLYFYSRNDGLQDQNVIFVTEDLNAAGRVLFDPNTFSDDGTVSLSSYSVSPTARYAAYSISDGGSDWRTWRIRDIASGEDLPDVLDHTKFTGASWTPDEEGFYYSRYPLDADGNGDDSRQVSIYYHRVGTDQDEDDHIYSITDHPTRNPGGSVTDDGRYLIINVFDGYETNGVYYVDLQEASGEVIRLFDQWDARYSVIGNDGSTFLVRTNYQSPRYRVVAVDLDNPGPDAWRAIVPQAEETLHGAGYVGGRIVASYLKDARSQVKIFEIDGTFVREVELPGVGSAGGFAGDPVDHETFYTFSSFTSPTSIYRYNIDTGESELFFRPDVGLDLGNYVTHQVFYDSPDGTRVPMFISHRRDVTPDGNNPTLLYGYGGFNVSLTPRYSSSRMAWMEMGGILAIPNLRGGGEYGEAWHQAGTKMDKQNVFDDFIAAAEWLIDNSFTSTRRLAIQGGSNGGLLVGAVMTQRPDLFAAALPAVGVLDMLRYHTASANARQWSSDYGLSENAEEYEALRAYSPVHNVARGVCYPPTMVTTADHDDRVVPWHSFKFGAELQYAQGCDNPILIRVETRAGHGAGTPTWMRIEQVADQWAFLYEMLDMGEGRLTP